MSHPISSIHEEKTATLKVRVTSLGSGKVYAVTEACHRLFPDEMVEVIPCPGDSFVDDRPLGEETYLGVQNRMLPFLNEEYDYLVSIEGGYEIRYGHYFIFTVVIVRNKQGKLGINIGGYLELSQVMYDYVRQGNSLNKAIEQVTGSNQKQKGGVTEYLTYSASHRHQEEIDLIIKSFSPLLNESIYQALEDKINQKA